MKKALLFLISFTSISLAINAQTESSKSALPISFSLGAEVGFPVGNNVAEYSAIFGGTAQAEFKFANKLGVTGRIGYLNYSYKTVFSKGNLGFVPVLAGLKYYISPRAFIFLQAGAAFGLTSITDAQNAIYLNKGTFFAYSPGVGHKFGKHLDAEFKFLGLSNSNHQHINSFGLRLGYTF